MKTVGCPWLPCLIALSISLLLACRDSQEPPGEPVVDDSQTVTEESTSPPPPARPLRLDQAGLIFGASHPEGMELIDRTQVTAQFVTTHSLHLLLDFYERELLYLRPDVFVVFDRVQTVDPTYRKVWAAHTVDPPTVADLSPSPGPGHGDLHGRHPDRHRQPGERHPHRHPAPGAEPGHHPRRGHTARKVIHPTLRK